MAPPKKRGGRRKRPLIDTLPELLVTSLAGNRDFILAFETDEETGKRTVHVLTGQFFSPCMLRKVIGQAESQKDCGGSVLSRRWK